MSLGSPPSTHVPPTHDEKGETPGGWRSYQHVASCGPLPHPCTCAHHLQWISRVPSSTPMHLTLPSNPQQYSDNLQRVRPKCLPEPRVRAVGRCRARGCSEQLTFPMQKAEHQVAWMLPFRYGYLDVVSLDRIESSC